MTSGLRSVLGKAFKFGSGNDDSKILRVFSNRAMDRSGKLVSIGTLNTITFKQLSHFLQRINGFLFRFGGEAVHQVGVRHYIVFGKIMGYPGYLRNIHPFFHFRQ